MISGNKLNLAYTLKAGESQKDLKGLNIIKYEITDGKGRILGKAAEWDKDKKQVIKDNNCEFNSVGFGTYNEKDFLKNRAIKGFFEFRSEKTNIEIPESITIKVTQLSENPINYPNNVYSDFYKKNNRLAQVIDGEWTINIKLDKKFIEAESISYKPAQQINNDLIKFEYINIYPTVANCKYIVDKNLNINVSSVYLEDEKRNVYKNTEYGIFGNDKTEHKMNFESPYFDKPQKLYLVIEDAELRDSKKKMSYRIELVKSEK